MKPLHDRETVAVALGSRSYDVEIGPGLLATAGARLAEAFPARRFAIVTDNTVAAIHLPTLAASLDRAGLVWSSATVPPGEGSKRFATLETVVDAIVAAKLERGDVVLALGGGVIGDLAGFAAAIVRRGMRFVQIPTTLLAQVDSSVGGKTGINSPRGKNLIGAFHQPSLVLADTGVLDTLPQREFAAGYAEMAKCALIDDAAFFARLERDGPAIFAGGPERVRAIADCVRSKARVVAADEHETGERALLNLGHTFGHALEAACGYDGARLTHGEAVAIGIRLAFEFSVEQGLAPPEDAERASHHLAAAGLPTHIRDVPGPAITAAELMDGIGQDKKVERGRLTFILTRGIGQAFIARDVQPERVLRFLEGRVAG